MPEIDWRELTNRLAEERTENVRGTRRRTAVSGQGRMVLSWVVGDALLLNALEHVISGRPGSSLAMSVLKLLRPNVATTACLELWQRETSVEQRCFFLMLLNNFADESIGVEIPRLLAYPDPTSQACAMQVLRSAVWDGMVAKAAAAELAHALRDHPSAAVRQEARALKRTLGKAVKQPHLAAPTQPRTRSAGESPLAVNIDWHVLTEALGGLLNGQEFGSDRIARAAIEYMIGEYGMQRAREIVATRGPGWPAARAALALLSRAPKDVQAR